jgi:hypothetical protein
MCRTLAPLSSGQPHVTAAWPLVSAPHARISPPHPSSSLISPTRACSNAAALLRLRLRRRGCVTAATSSVLAATSSILLVPSSHPSFLECSSILAATSSVLAAQRPAPSSSFLHHSRRSLNVSPFIVQSSPSTDPFTTVMFPVRSSTSPKSVCHRTCLSVCFALISWCETGADGTPCHTPSYPSASSPILVP